MQYQSMWLLPVVVSRLFSALEQDYQFQFFSDSSSQDKLKC